MPGFKLKSILSRVVLGESWRERNSSDYLYAGIDNNSSESHSREHIESVSDDDNEDEDSDRNSINSFSTTATTSNLPGAGRTVDTYIYQPVGRGIERLAKRLSSRRRTVSEDIGAVVIRSTTATADTIDNDDSASSINSFSTTATADNLAGTGRAIDMYLYQPMGRRIERVAMRFTIAFLNPARIAQYIEVDNGVYPSFDDSMTLHDAIAELCSARSNGSTIVAGLKGLVKQTQSNSIDRSAAALAALIRVCLCNYFREIYANISLIEPIFHLETLAKSLVRSHPDRKWFLLLVKLARVSLISIRNPQRQERFDSFLRNKVWQLWPSPEDALNLRQRLIRVLKVYRLSGLDSLDDTIGDACSICAEAVSTCIDYFASGDAYIHILYTVYFTVIFILRSIYELADFARITANRHIYMVMRSMACWLDAIVYHCVTGSDLMWGIFYMDLLKVAIAFRSLAFIDGGTLLPETFNENGGEVLIMAALPRRHRQATKRGKDTPPIQRLIEAAEQRTRRLFKSFNELEKQVWECASQTDICSSQLEIAAHPRWSSAWDFGDEWWEQWESTLERARNVQVTETVLTEEFRKARRIGLEGELQYGNWAGYQFHRLTRHKWGQYFRSDMDWDWDRDRDLGTCMRHLFKVEQIQEGQPIVSRNSPVPYSEIDVDAEQGTTCRPQARGSLPKEVQVACNPDTGDSKYMSFTPAYPSPGYCPISKSTGAGNSAEESFEHTGKGRPGETQKSRMPAPLLQKTSTS